jgi:hypothetical protein
VSNIARQLGILALLCAVALCATTAEAGYVAFDSESSLTAFSFEMSASTSGSSSSSAPFEQNQKDQQPLNLFDAPQMAMHLGQSGSGGATSMGSSSGSQAPVGLVVNPDALTPALITPLFLGDEPFSPRMAISEIFRPPCA